MLSLLAVLLSSWQSYIQISVRQYLNILLRTLIDYKKFWEELSTCFQSQSQSQS
jgi:hypothetical protein